MSSTHIATVEVDGVRIFYRYAGAENAPTVVLLHGFPSSSHMFRNLIPQLATKYRVIAPDLPGFGFTDVPQTLNYQYTFENLSKTFAAFVDALSLQHFAIYIFDYGAPVALRFALNHPESVAAIITQNGNAYVDGFGASFWAPLEKYWATGNVEDREALRGATTLEITKWQYTDGSPNPEAIPPEAYFLDQALMDRPGNKDIQLDILYDYRTNVPLYPQFQEYFRKSDIPVLAIWGKNDTIFIAPGAEAYQRDVQKFELRWLDAGHFALETNEDEVAKCIDNFLIKHNVF
ncbi:Alpha/Beta hydrolase protein [Dactylonectria macrodidyma]|uniref:Alpha/Beta hydrolase protein n=1 Tax=Dactylonectria macrodidyma TaxID=307937 RepID=A0A9P9EQC7_9HYPO|nr:Alpha/Beta hydrolase protein [Dactylonectria macrodidyma]